jgi:hypothetical protein
LSNQKQLYFSSNNWTATGLGTNSVLGFVQVGKVDLTPPTLSLISVSPAVVNTTNASASVTVNVIASGLLSRD